jgi:hypothetical protein
VDVYFLFPDDWVKVLEPVHFFMSSIIGPLLLILHLLFPTVVCFSQSNSSQTIEFPLKRTLTKRETRHFGFGGDITLAGAPVGSVTIEGWKYRLRPKKILDN